MKHIKEYAVTRFKKYIKVYTEKDLKLWQALISKKYNVNKSGYGEYEFINIKNQTVQIPDMMYVSIDISVPVEINFKKTDVSFTMDILFGTYYNSENENFLYDNLDVTFVIKNADGAGICDKRLSNSHFWMTPKQMSELPDHLYLNDNQKPKHLLINLEKKMYHTNSIIKFDNDWEKYWIEKIKKNPPIYLGLKNSNFINDTFEKTYKIVTGIGKIGHN